MNHRDPSDVAPNLTLSMVEAKEKELEERRQAIHRRQQVISSRFGPDPNFPPEFLCIKPQVYHNIKEQVPVDFQRFMYILCTLYVSTIVLILYNIVCAFVNFLLGGSAAHFALSFIYLIGLPGAFIVWYFNVYSAITDRSRPRQLLSYLGLLIAVLFDGWMALGLPGLGGCGWMITLGITNRVPAFIMFLISSVLWSAHGVILFLMLAHYWRTSSNIRRSVYENDML